MDLSTFDRQNLFDIADIHVQQAILTAFDALRDIYSLCMTRHRSASAHHKTLSHRTNSRCSLPSTKTDLNYCQSRLFANKRQHIESRRLSRSTRIQTRSRQQYNRQYSFSLHRSWVNNNQRSQDHSTTVETFADHFIDRSIQIALEQIDRSLPITFESQIVTNEYVDRLIQSTMAQSIGDIYSLAIEYLSQQLVDDILVDALSIIGEKHAPTELISTANYEQYLPNKTDSLHETRIDSLSISNLSTYLTDSKSNSLNNMVNMIAQQIYTRSLDHLREYSLNHTISFHQNISFRSRIFINDTRE
jgi:hypothetical protein